MKKSILYSNSVLLLIFSQLLIGMEAVMPAVQLQVLGLVIHHKHLCFHHKDICSLAWVNKESEKAIRNTASERKKHLEALVDPKVSVLALCGSPLTWHEYGSMCAAQARIDYTIKHSTLDLRMFTYNGDTVSVMCSQEFRRYPKGQGEYKSLFDRVKIDQNGGIFCHGFGTSNDKMLWGNNFHIIEYSCSKEQQSRERRCAIRVKDGGESYALSYLIPFTSLFKALLQAPIALQDEKCKFYDLSRATIPDDYRKVGKDYLYLYSAHNYFDYSLPDALRNGIVKRYEEQKQK